MQSPQVVACSKVISIHSFESAAPIKSYCPHRGVINCVSWNHNNKVIASCGIDGKMTLMAADNPQASLLDLHFDPIKFNSNSKYIAAGGTDSVVKIWEIKSNSRDVYLNLKQHFAAVSSVCWGRDQDSQILASANVLGDVYLNSIKGGDVVETFTTKNQDGVNMVRISPQNKLAVCTNGGSVMVWDIARPNSVLCDFKNVHKGPASAISFSSFKPALLVSVSHDQKLNFYDVIDKKPIKTVIDGEEPLTSVCFYGDGHTIVLGGINGSLLVYDLRMPSAPNGRLSGHESAIKSIDLIHYKQNPKQNSTVGPTSFKSASQLSGNTIHTNSQKGIGLRQQKILTNQKSQSRIPTVRPPPPPSTHRISIPQKQIKQQQPLVNNYMVPKSQLSTITQPVSSNKNLQISQPAPKQGALQQMQKRLKAEMQSQFQLMHLQIIRQFQIQQKQMQNTIQRILSNQHKKDEYIRKLQQENQKLKKHSF